jgi:hypothetical protein
MEETSIFSGVVALLRFDFPGCLSKAQQKAATQQFSVLSTDFTDLNHEKHELHEEIKSSRRDAEDIEGGYAAGAQNGHRSVGAPTSLYIHLSMNRL